VTDRRAFLAAAPLALASALPYETRAADAGSAHGALPASVRAPKFELVYECDATLSPAIELGKTVEGNAVLMRVFQLV